MCMKAGDSTRVRVFVVALAGVTAFLMAGCSSGLPTAPSELMKGIGIYQDADFRGRSASVMTSIRDLGNLSSGPCKAVDTGASVINFISGALAGGSTSTIESKSWDDCISSIRVAPGAHAIVYRDPDFHGQSLEIVSDVPDLKLVRMNDEISSIRVVSP